MIEGSLFPTALGRQSARAARRAICRSIRPEFRKAAIAYLRSRDEFRSLALACSSYWIAKTDPRRAGEVKANQQIAALAKSLSVFAENWTNLGPLATGRLRAVLDEDERAELARISQDPKFHSNLKSKIAKARLPVSRGRKHNPELSYIVGEIAEIYERITGQKFPKSLGVDRELKEIVYPGPHFVFEVVRAIDMKITRSQCLGFLASMKSRPELKGNWLDFER